MKDFTVKQLSRIFENVNAGVTPLTCFIETDGAQWKIDMFTGILENVELCPKIKNVRMDGTRLYFDSMDGRIPGSVFSVTNIAF